MHVAKTQRNRKVSANRYRTGRYVMEGKRANEEQEAGSIFIYEELGCGNENQSVDQGNQSTSQYRCSLASFRAAMACYE